MGANARTKLYKKYFMKRWFFMKNAKKIFAVLVVLALALSMVIPAAAEEASDG